VIARRGSDLPFVVAVALCVLPPGIARSTPCDSLVVPYSNADQVRDEPFLIERSLNEGGVLLYYGAVHSRDPAHPQFEDIASAWERTRPTVVFYEGPERPLPDSARDAITQFGESGYVRWLGRRDGARIERLEPPVSAELEYVLRTFTPEQVKLFFVLREASRLRDVEHQDEKELTASIAALLEKTAALPDIGSIITTVDALQAAYAKHWKRPPYWWQVPRDWFSPMPQHGDERFTYAVNRASSHFRNVHMVRVLTARVLAGERVFGVVGRNHVPMQRAAIDCVLTRAAAE
jgi:hypothetical protein